MPKITKRLVENTKCSNTNKDEFLWDDEVRGFGVRIKLSGVRSYIVQYRNKFGRSRRYTIGQHGRWTAEEARKEAKQILAETDRGGDPSEIREQDRRAMTMANLCDRYLDEHARQHKKPGSIKSDEANINNHVLPLLGNKSVVSITRADIETFKRNVKTGKAAKREKVAPRSVVHVRGGTGVANRCLALLSKMFNLAEKWGIRPDATNPCRHIDKYKERKIERYLSEQELANLAQVLNETERTQTESPAAIAAIRLLLFTGARMSEILTLRWEHVDFESQCLRLPDSKTGEKVVYLAAPALEVLDGLDRDPGSLFVIQGQIEGAHLVNLQKPWSRIRAMADLDDVRIHDLRHSFASMAVAGGLSLPVIGALLGHTQPATTARYAHLADDPLKQAANLTGARIAAAMKVSKSVSR